MLHFGISVDSLQARRVITFVVGSGATTTMIPIFVGHQFPAFESSGASFVWADGSVMYEQGRRELWAHPIEPVLQIRIVMLLSRDVPSDTLLSSS